MTTSERLDCIASAIRSAECLNAIHTCRPNHPMGFGDNYKWRNAHFMVMGRPYEERREIAAADLDWLKGITDKEMSAAA